MRVYDVVSVKNLLDEAYEVASRTTSAGKTYIVVDPVSGKELGAYRTPGQARLAADDANKKVQANKDKEKADAAQSDKEKAAAAEKEENEKKEKIKKTDRFYRNLKISAGALHAMFSAFAIKVSIDQHIKEQTGTYDAYLSGAYGTVGSSEAVKRWEERSQIIYGAWVSQTVATILASGANALIAAKIINGIKAARAAGLAAGIASAGIGSVIAFVLAEAATYGIVWLLNKPSTVKALVEYTWNAPAISKAFITASKVNPDVSLDPDVEKNLQQAMGMDKRKEAGDTVTKKNYTSPKPTPTTAPPAAGANSTSTAPPASSPGGSSTAQTQGNWASSFLD